VSENASIYPVNKGINRAVEFQGLKAQYIIYAGAGLVLLLIVFAVSFMLGCNTYLLLGFTLPAGAGIILLAAKFSKQYGEHGLNKNWASKQTPLCVRSKTWKPFFLSGK
jgi:hypothetical protein